jgi:16S rRNA U516 pseudouridylate synthase RsuA-like enzyme
MSDEAPKTPSGDRIAKVLARAGVASRRGAEAIIEAGRVQVNVITSGASLAEYHVTEPNNFAWITDLSRPH